MTDVRDFIASEAQNEMDKAEQLRRAKVELAGPLPLIAEAPDCSVTLPRGLYAKGGYKRVAHVRELTGADEETLAKVKDNLDFFDTVIALGTESIDDVDLSSLPTAERQGQLRTLLIGERDQLFVAVVKATFGNTRKIGFRCTVCNEDQEVELILSEDFKPKEVEDVDATLFTFTTSKGHELQYRLVTGDDQQEAFSRKGATVAEQNTIILSKVITKANGGLIPDPLAYVRSMSMRDRQELLAVLVSKQPTIDLTLKTKCAACSSDQTLGLDWGDLFRAR